jgi:hypothetical protein
MVYLTSSGVAASTANIFLTTSNNVGIGTTVTDVGCQLKLFNSTYGGQIGLCNGQQTDTSAYLRFGMDSGWSGYIALNGYWNGSSFQAVNGPAYGGFQAARMSFGSSTAAFMTFDTASGPSTTTTFSWTERMRILNSGNIGIGTTSPQTTLDVNGILNVGTWNNVGTAINITTYGLERSRYTLQFPTYRDVQNYKIGAKIIAINKQTYADTSARQAIQSTDLAFFTTPPDTTTTDSSIERLRITDTGQITMPYQPCFSAYRDAGDVPANTVFVWNQVQANTGSCYSSATGRFTAPVAGNYYFSVHCMATGGPTTYINVAIRKNGSVYTMGHGTNAAYTHASARAVIPLAVNDYVDIFNVGGYTTVYASGPYNNFNGHLIG